jgi:hypothetical protein
MTSLVDHANLIASKTPERVHHDIAGMLSKGVSHIDALVLYAKQENMEIETLAEIIKKSSLICEKIKEEGIKLRMVKEDIKRSNTLF